MSNVNLPPEDLNLIEDAKDWPVHGIGRVLDIITRYQKALEVALDLSQGWNAERRRRVQEILEAK